MGAKVPAIHERGLNTCVIHRRVNGMMDGARFTEDVVNDMLKNVWLR